ncbi:calcium-translocating P-type ATPase, SERCA-type [Peptoniphilus sp. KCTC 25270]|uniref:calcium-translocating P-type ATPase, SERCA-type n=1 Tax=Peptoniphilus sp. KCTC 25270 TaxID=2897414 RepID=UPI001E50B95A|nr:calcium-translocating P-type ATPase, SERCA-type [Peptoniphilus sp. KCTC 25270]MCD1146504.1 calcium-translocating P-type ATPase, SERCA-type [Peptoniphilus sp. KCTC 25270]
MDWYKKSVDDVLSELKTDATSGLTIEESEKRLSEYGPNELAEEAKKPFMKKLLEQFLDPMIIILLLAAIISGVVGEVVDSIIILAIVIINAALSLYQEGKAEEAISALKKMSSPTVKVIRSGKVQEIDSTTLVPGDLVVLETGDIVPADLRLIESSNLKIDESSLTGESVAVDKNALALPEGEQGIGDRENYAYSASIVTYGRGRGIVAETGLKTEIGKIATSISAMEEEQTPLQRKLAQLSKSLGLLVIGVCIVVFVVGLLYGHETLGMFLTAISLAVAAIPEGLPAIVTIVLSMGMGNMAKKNAIVKRLLAVETLGTTTYICSDKTGTLTQNEMTVTRAFVDGKEIKVSGTGYEPKGDITFEGSAVTDGDFPSLHIMSTIATLTNDADLDQGENGYRIIGDPTEGALLTFAGKQGYEELEVEKKYPRLQEIPFDSDRKMMTTFHENFFDGKVSSFTKGAPDIILKRCNRISLNGEVVDLTEDLRKEILDANSHFAKNALRVLAFAYNNYDTMPEERTSEAIEKDMIFVGLTGMIDPARPEVKEAIRECKSAGIVPVMITGDYLETAVAIADDLGILAEGENAMMGEELNGKSPEEIQEIVKTTRVFARVSPENKVQIVTALKQNGEIAAMTGDGVNDAPAIKKADIGIAMGITGTDVAKNTSDVILTDDNFATIVGAVEEGRIIYANIKKFVTFLLSCNIGEVLVVLLSILMNLPTPFLPIQLLWLNLITDSFPALALGVEKGEAETMLEPPRDPKEPILDRKIIVTLAIQSIAITIATLGTYYIALETHGYEGEGLVYARTMAFGTLVFSELFRSFSSRSIDDTLFKLGFFTNKRLLQAVAISVALTLLVLYVPFLEELFHLTDLSMKDWAFVLVASLIPLVLGEIQKMIRFRQTH